MLSDLIVKKKKKVMLWNPPEQNFCDKLGAHQLEMTDEE